jgi:hypothetical protein
VNAGALDPIIANPDLWKVPRADFGSQVGQLGFYWLSASQQRAESHRRDLTLFSNHVYEADADFQGDTLSTLTISIFNRGDAGDITREQMMAKIAQTITSLNALTKTQYEDEGEEASDAVKAHALKWQTAATQYLLEYSFTKEVKSWSIPFRAEFIRLRVMPAEKPKSFMAQALAAAAPATQAVFNGPSHVKKNAAGDVAIDSIPMVDQGQKGYCVVATVERVMRYYGIPVDEHEVAELANSSAAEGTDTDEMLDSLKKLSQRLQVRVRAIEAMDAAKFLALIKEYNRAAQHKHSDPIPLDGSGMGVLEVYHAMKPEVLEEARTHNQAEVDQFQKTVQDNVDQGIPILWCVMYGLVPEKMGPKGIGGHMRLIIGYNSDTHEILYSDSWGPGHELKRMSVADAWTMTTAMDSIEPISTAGAN